MILTLLGYDERHEAVVDVDLHAHVEHLGDVLVVQVDEVLVHLLQVSLVCGDGDVVASLQLNLSCHTLRQESVECKKEEASITHQREASVACQK